MKAPRKALFTDAQWDEAINEWINGSLRNSPVSANTETWNHLMSQTGELRKIMERQARDRADDD